LRWHVEGAAMSRKRQQERQPGLSAKRQAFVAEYLKDFNASAAAIRAGYSPRTARSQAADLLTKPNIAKAIREAQEKAFANAEASVERTINEYARIAYLDPAAFFDAQGRLLPIAQMPEDARRAVASMEVEELFAGSGDERRRVGRLHKVRFASKVAALDSLAKHLGMFVDRLELRGGSGLRVHIHYNDAHGE
jgi:phage terminase small subunit